jgi:hypothetical protein
MGCQLNPGVIVLSTFYGRNDSSLYYNTMLLAKAKLCDNSTLVSLFYKHFTIVIYNRNDVGQYYKTTVTIVIDDLS